MREFGHAVFADDVDVLPRRWRAQGACVRSSQEGAEHAPCGRFFREASQADRPLLLFDDRGHVDPLHRRFGHARCLDAPHQGSASWREKPRPKGIRRDAAGALRASRCGRWPWPPRRGHEAVEDRVHHGLEKPVRLFRFEQHGVHRTLQVSVVDRGVELGGAGACGHDGNVHHEGLRALEFVVEPAVGRVDLEPSSPMV